MRSEVNLTVNDKPVTLDEFVKELIDSTIVGILIVLEGVEEIQKVDLKIEGERVLVLVNGEQVPLSSFVANAIRNTICGMISSFKGVQGIETARIEINRRVPGCRI
jgi:sulfur carrier protein ThiS